MEVGSSEDEHEKGVQADVLKERNFVSPVLQDFRLQQSGLRKGSQVYVICHMIVGSFDSGAC